MLELTIRLVASLAIVVGLLLLLARLGARRFSGSSKAVVHVLHRQQLSKASALAVVSVGSRVLVLGTTDHQVSLLAELEPADLEPADLEPADLEPAVLEPAVLEPAQLEGARPDPAEPDVEELPPARLALAVSRDLEPEALGPDRRRVGRHALDVPATGGPLAGSLLSPQTWRDALAAATRGA